MIRLFNDEYTRLDKFLEECSSEELTYNAQRALALYVGYDKLESYAVIKIKGYFCITRIMNDMITWANVRNLIQPFDEKKVYPLQEFKKTLDWVY